MKKRTEQEIRDVLVQSMKRNLVVETPAMRKAAWLRRKKSENEVEAYLVVLRAKNCLIEQGVTPTKANLIDHLTELKDSEEDIQSEASIDDLV